MVVCFGQYSLQVDHRVAKLLQLIPKTKIESKNKKFHAKNSSHTKLDVGLSSLLDSRLRIFCNVLSRYDFKN